VTRVLLATDGSADARAAAEWLAAFPLPADTRVLVLAAVALPPSPLDIPTVREFERALLDDGRRTADEAAARLGPRFGAAEVRVVPGDPREEIVRAAEEWAADLVVVGARGLGAVATALLGSVSLAVARHAPCAVLVVRPHPAPLRSAVVAIDGSAGAEEAARFFAGLSLPRGLAVRLVGVVEPPQAPRTAPAVADDLLRAAIALITDDRRRALQEALERAAERFDAPALTHELPVGPPGETLERLAASPGVHLMVLGARGLGGLKRLVLGSVSERVLRHAACPVLIVHGQKRP
jgi:nucleotide-binding universal stress UspA family protein